MSTTLTAGDIAFLSIIGDTPDTFSFVLLKDITVGTIINVTDNGWLASGAFRTGEGVLQYVAPTAQAIGTVITYVDGAANTGWTNISGGTNFALSTSGDSLIGFQGTLTGTGNTTTSTSPTLLAAVTINRSTFDADAINSNTSALPTGLTLGTNAVAVGQASLEFDNSRYTGPTTFASVAAARTAINTASNWTGSDTDITNFSGTFSIGGTTNSNPTVTLSVSANAGTEAGTTAITVTATASSAVTGNQTVSLGVTGTGITAGDYTLSNTIITIPGGSTTGAVTFTVVNDVLVEGAETATLTISSPSSGITLGSTTTQNITITDNDGFLTKIGGYQSANGAEIPAFDAGSKRLFVVAGSVVEVLNLTNPATPTKISDLAFNTSALTTGFNLVPNSVAVGKAGTVSEGIVAVALAMTNPTTADDNPGEVQFFTAATGAFLGKVTVGFLPDMVVFTPDGTKVLTANEGQPNNAYTTDPVGSVSIINLASGVATATVQSATFDSFNGQKASLQAAGVRIFGPDLSTADPTDTVSVAQDLEPEYIAFSGDGTKAWVTLQENNAIAVVNIATATVESILPLGMKDHNSVTVTNLETFQFKNLPSIGTAAGQELFLGGFSGLFYEGTAANGNLKFVTNTDRGPNGEPTGSNRPFLLPNFSPEIVRFELNRSTGAITLTSRIGLKRADGTTPITGLPNLDVPSGTANTAFNDEDPVNLNGTPITPLDPFGGDFEGIVVASDNSFWLVDEYRPAIYNFNASGVLIERFVPTGTAAAVGQTAGAFGTEALPAVLAQRRQNRGFEAVALNKDNNKLYAFVQSPLRNPTTLSNTTLNGLNNIRIVEFDLATKAVTAQYLYRMDNSDLGTPNNTRPDKIGDAVYIGNGEFLVIERDDDAIDSGDALSNIEKKIYRFSLAGATNINGQDAPINGKTIDQMSATELAAAGITAIRKTLHVDLAKAGYTSVEKVEGLALVDANTIAVINDNDFQVGGITINPDGTFIPDSTPEPVILGLITTNSNGFDASDRDLNGTNGKINIQNWPVFGLYQPDSIASFSANGQTYYVTANEGDSRGYAGFSEEVRVGAASYVLDPTVFPNATTLKNNVNLGRLQVTNATGNLDGDGDIDQIQAFGARSFSIWDSNGKLVYDSGDDLEQITAAAFPTRFNASHDNNTLDDRSDNKGPEPEGVAVGVINGRTYAFIGLERIGGVMVYEVTNPTKPAFVQYLNTRDFSAAVAGDSGPEGLSFISASDSPNSQPLLVVANEVSNTVAVYSVNPGTRISDIQGSSHISPLRGQAVTNVPGIVTALASNGFYLQDPNPDTNIATSEGIFVFTSSAPTVAVGDAITVSGTVSEFTGGSSSTNPTNNLSVTQITSPTVTVISKANPLPTAIVLGTGGRVPPSSTIQSAFTLASSFSVNNLLMEEIQEVRPTSNTNASGSVSFTFDNATSTLTVNGTFGSLSSALQTVGESSVHIHTGGVGVNGGIARHLTVTPTNAGNTAGTFTGTFTLTATEVATLRSGGFYVNLHTANNPSGELRGQLFPNVAENASFDPTTDGQDFYESLEGMRVQVNNPVASSPTNTFGTSEEIWVLGDNGTNASSRTVKGGSLITETDYNPERIQIDDLINSLVLPSVKVGDRLSNLVGVVNYDFGNYEVLVSEAPTVVEVSALTKEITNLVGTPSKLTIATFNVENLGGNDAQSRFDAIGAAIVTNLKTPDIISLEEIQDNNGATNDGVVAANTTYDKLIASISAAGGPTYSYRQIDPVNNQDGGQTGGNIRVGFLFNANRVSFVDRGDVTVNRATTGVTVQDANNDQKPELSLSPGRIVDSDLTNGDTFNASRKPLVGEFKFNSETIFVVGNHWNSKGGDQPLFGRVQPPEQFTETQRNLQAQAIAAFVTNLRTVDPNAKVVVLGDLNDFEFSQSLTIAEAAGLTTLIETLPANERYTYNFEGNAQTLDHILVSNNLTAKAQYDVVHINSEFPDQLSDHDPSVVSLDIPAPYTLQLLSYYGESGLLGVQTAPIMGALIDKFDDQYSNTLVLGEGDSYIPGPWLIGGADPSLNSVPGIGTTALGRPDIAIMNAFGTDASALGNHEFDLGSPVLQAAIAASGSGATAWVGAQFPLITANLDFSADSSLRGLADATIGGTSTNAFAGKEANTIKGKIAPYTVVTQGGEKIGIVGATTYDLLIKSSPNGTVPKDDGIPSTDDLQEVAAYIQASVNALKSLGVNKIVMVDQLDTIERNKALAPLVSGIDIMVAGGGHERLGDSTDKAVAFNGHDANFTGTFPIVTAGSDGKPTLIVTTDTEYTYLGRLVVNFDTNGEIIVSDLDPTINGAYASTEATLQAAYGSTQTAKQIVASSTIGAKVDAITGAINNVIVSKDGNIFGYTNVYLEGDCVFGRTQEVNLGNISADANLFKARAALGSGAILASLKNGGGLRASVGSVAENGTKLPPTASSVKPAGAISQLDVENALRFDNKLMVFDTTPTGLKNILEFAAGLSSGASQQSGGYAQIGGLRFSYDPTKAAGQKVQDAGIYDLNNNLVAKVIDNGVILAGAPTTISVVVLNFTANGGDGYPIKANADNFRYLLNNGTLSAPIDKALDFTAAANVPANALGEQKAFEDFLKAVHGTPQTAYALADTPATQDQRIQNLQVKTLDTVFPFELTLDNSIPGGKKLSLAVDPGKGVLSNPIARVLKAEEVTALSNFATPSVFPLGLLQFNVDSLPVTAGGATSEVKILLPQNSNINGYAKLINGKWESFLYNGETGAEFKDLNGDGTNDILLHLKDGGRGDNDGIINGSISDPGAPTTVTPGLTQANGVFGAATSVDATVQARWIASPASNYEFGFINVDDSIGTIGGLKPTDAGYLSAALARKQSIFNGSSSASGSALTRDSVGNFRNSESQSVGQLRGTTLNTGFNLFYLTEGGQTTLSNSGGGKFNSTSSGQGYYQFDFTDSQGRAVKFEVGTPTFVTPGVAGGKVKVDLSISRAAAFNNTFGIYKVDDLTGGLDTNGDGVVDMLTGSQGYAAAALNRSKSVGQFQAPANNSTSTSPGFVMDAGQLFGLFIVSNGSVDNVLNPTNQSSGNSPAVFFSFAGANSDGQAHMMRLGSGNSNVFGFEDMVGGGDRDFNDVIVSMNIQTV